MQTFGGPRGRMPFPVPAPAGDGFGGTERLLIGLHVGSGCGEISGAVVAVSGRGLAARFEPVVSASQEVPTKMRDCFARLERGDGGFGESSQLARTLTDLHLDLIRKLASLAAVPKSDILAIGLQDPGIWQRDSSGVASCWGFCDTARLAESSTCNVVDAFADRDIAGGGPGGPLTAIPHWLLLGEADRTRLVLDIGRSVRLTFLPAGKRGGDVDRLLAFDVGPGTSLLDSLSKRLSEGRLQFDPGGKLAVQGKKIPDLVEHWLADPYFQESPPRWQPHGVRADNELYETVRMAADSGWSIRDLLCTATHFIADCIAHAVEYHLPKSSTIDELLVTGGGQDNGMLLGEIGLRLNGIPLKRTAELGLPTRLLEATTVAVLTALHVDMVPANHPAITGTAVPRILGRLTPGSPGAWARLVRHLDSTAPTHTSLRNAV